jgi:hypothetical protein
MMQGMASACLGTLLTHFFGIEVAERGGVVPEAQLGGAFERQSVTQAHAKIGGGMLESSCRCDVVRRVETVSHGVPNACSRPVARQLDESDADAIEAFVTELAIEDGVQFFTEQLLEPKRTNTCARIGAAPRVAVTSIAHGAHQSDERTRRAVPGEGGQTLRLWGASPAQSLAKVLEIGQILSRRDAYAATAEMITRYAELIFDISIISHLF